ncbi:unnamed protein product [Dibothriocephalus latus]|uniref:CFAP61 dimerisation domain-containing protein n=1 Tax=Dibothriocephalus latus TaxID=60516 RepID=A0A3P7P438_DIBLA|nr:unnamed protein product [Dibothriocephalus latus]
MCDVLLRIQLDCSGYFAICLFLIACRECVLGHLAINTQSDMQAAVQHDGLQGGFWDVKTSNSLHTALLIARVIEPSVFEDQTVETAVEEAMINAKVHIKKGYVVAQWNDEADAVTTKKIKSVSFISAQDTMRIRCVAFFSFYKKGVDYEFFKAVNDACLVFDGRLVIDVNFHTNDPCIRAAGPVTKLQPKSLLQLFDPSVKTPERPVKDEHHLLPTFKIPRIKLGQLPGDYRYLKVWAPGQRKELRERMSQANFGRALVTGVPESGPGYFHLHINEYNEVSRVCCLSKNVSIAEVHTHRK